MELLYEYAVIRVVPRVEREEFVNTGIILFCKKTGFLDCRISLDKTKVLCFDPTADMHVIEENVNAFARITRGEVCESMIAKLPAAERFRWLTATRSTIIQCSKVHPGYARNETEALDGLIRRFFSSED